VISDSNAELIITYRIIKDHIEELIQELKNHKEHNDETYYYDIRSQDRDKKEFGRLNDIERAGRLIFLNKTCYNGLYRVNSQGLFNVPYGKYRNPAICEEPVLRAVNLYLNSNSITITNDDFEAAAKKADGESFVYLDPPYHSQDKTNFTGYQADGFNDDEQIRLRDTFLYLTKKNIPCLLSNSDTSFIRELYKDKCFDIITVSAKRAINSAADGRGNVNEVLIKNRS
jgi:DNA adenine methylase